MANIATRSDGRWRARYRDSAGKEHSRHFTRKIDAQHWLDAVTTSVTTGIYTDPRRSRITVREWSARWLAAARASAAAEKGGLLHLRNFRRASFDPAVQAAGLDGLTPHALRHTAASLAIAAGGNVKVVQTMLGHKSATMTLDLYGHLMADRLDEVADAVDAARTSFKIMRSVCGLSR
jgi:integrase